MPLETIQICPNSTFAAACHYYKVAGTLKESDLTHSVPHKIPVMSAMC